MEAHDGNASGCGMRNWFQKHPVALAIYAFLGFLLVSFPVWLADVWSLFSDRVFVDVLRENGWGLLIVGPYYGWACVGVGVVLAVLVALALSLPAAPDGTKPVAVTQGP